MIDEGDVVVATRDGARGPRGPRAVPVKGKTYRVKTVYPMPYGLGCTLEGMDHSPYRGFLLYVSRKRYKGWNVGEPGWYFEKVQEADSEFMEFLGRLATTPEDLGEEVPPPLVTAGG